MEIKTDFTLINILGGTKLDIKAEDMSLACAITIKMLFDQDKKWSAEETKSYSQEEAILLKGYDNDVGKGLSILVVKKEIADKEDMFAPWKNVR